MLVYLTTDSKANRELAVEYGYIDEKNLNYGISQREHENNEFCSYSDMFELTRVTL